MITAQATYEQFECEQRGPRPTRRVENRLVKREQVKSNDSSETRNSELDVSKEEIERRYENLEQYGFAEQTSEGICDTDKRDEFDHASLENAITARIDDETIPIGPLELQIAYKLYLGTQKDIEDAVHLYTLFEESLSVTRLEEWVTRLDVEAEYERLKRA